MNTPNSDTSPQTCSEAGLACENCIAGTARELAAVCKGLRGKTIGQLFVQIYTNSACAPMHKRFTMHYLNASAISPPAIPGLMPEPISVRREVTFARPRAIAAVA